MSDLRRYLDDEHADDVARELVTSARQDDVDDARADELMRAIAARSGLEPAARDQGSSSDAPAAPPSGSRLLVLGTVALVAVSGALVTTYVEKRPAALSPAPAVPTVVMTAVVPPSSAPLADVPSRSSDETVSVDRLPDAAPRIVTAHPARSVPNHARPEPASPAPTDLAGEVRALERVRVALAKHDVAGARQGLVDYEHSFPNKLLGEEARALEIERLLAEGRRDEAEALARVFLVSSGDTPYATRVRTLLGSSRLP